MDILVKFKALLNSVKSAIVKHWKIALAVSVICIVLLIIGCSTVDGNGNQFGFSNVQRIEEC